ncbi:MAG: hypothetical protein KC910_35385 [Candidatus Eremiobacteraeota bacterium]|nr:hypothetical protein [Candidatus Eremiobacteraeota bacterium]
MKRKTRICLLLAVFVVAALPVLAKAPEALTVFVNGYRVTGKALWYKGRIYVPLEDVASATNGQYNYDETNRTASVMVGPPNAAAGSPTLVLPSQAERPYLKVVWEKKYTTGTNARVLATVINRGSSQANDVEAICIFKDETLQEVSAVARPVGTLAPGQSRTVEFKLFESEASAPNYAYPGYAGYSYGAPIVSGVGRRGEVLLDGQWTRISYELKFNYN